MSNKVRIYELSRELNLDSKDILAVCEQLNIAAKSHSSTITESDAEQIRQSAQKISSSPVGRASAPKHRPEVSNSPQSGSPKASKVIRPRKQQILALRKQGEQSAPSADTGGQEPASPQRPPTAPIAKPMRPGASVPSPQRDASPPVSRPRLTTPPESDRPPAWQAPEPTSTPSPAVSDETSARSEPTPPSLLGKPVLRRAQTESAVSPVSQPQSLADEAAEPTLIKPQRPKVVRVKSAAEVESASDQDDLSDSDIAILADPLLDPDQEKTKALKLKRPTIGRPKHLEIDDADDEIQDRLNKPAKGPKSRRRTHASVEDEEDDDLLDEELNSKSAVDVSQSLVRPPKPKSASTPSRPVLTMTSRPSAGGRRGSRRDHRQETEKTVERPTHLTLTHDLTLQELASKLMVPDTEVIKALFLKGIAANINQTLDLAMAKTVSEELGVEVEIVEEASSARKVTEMLDVGDLENLHRRPPVVTIMGHVDHGKTTLLDSIRKTKVAQGEAGGITQHIGAYHVDVPTEHSLQQVVFLDTPGHEAFTAMRARGTRVTDIAVLVVAADDGVRPQTIEAISHAKAAEVPLIVAINKMDKEEAQPDRVQQELTEYGLVPEEWGGETIVVPVSALKGENLDSLLEMILLVAEVEDLQANPDRPAKGTVIEAHLDKARGPVASLLVQNGTLKVGDVLVAGSVFGRVRAMIDDRGERVEEASPSFAVEVLGLGDVPAAGDEFDVFLDEKEARAVASDRVDAQRQSRLQQALTSRRVSLGSFSDQAREGELKELNLILKADVQGSVEAILGSLGQLPQKEVQVRVLLSAPGEISETDVDLASASNAVIVGFNTSLASGARQAADEAGVDIRDYNIIYKLLEDIEAAMEGLLEPELVEEALGQAEVRAVFPVGRGAVAGCYVQSGKLVRNCKVRIHRNSQLLHEGVLDSLKRMKEDSREVNAGYECGVGLDSFSAWSEGDLIEAFRMVTKRRTLSAN
ncbi:translation initiation factor IF-2 [Synechococcales cyanobacterium C]|uniref:Translation initiation factor IF-2 n=1 Tax=Petrachloros mirabilis ULC683 TaxID=2781853 RepID=A0A8K1ZVN1_9CYAN|nr:translation initiation factor IF-2 [Petrachloros mirabilis]NCJ04978.1 translation initiation factor IF-2 [Petrachloros mirabilis ULC683]